MGEWKKGGGGEACVTVLSFPVVYPMGNGTSRLYSALAKTLNSSAAAQHPEYLVTPDTEHLEPIDPKELLEECRAVLHTRPPRFQRDFVDLRADGPSSHPPIRVMQWNILAQGMPAMFVPGSRTKPSVEGRGVGGVRGGGTRAAWGAPTGWVGKGVIGFSLINPATRMSSVPSTFAGSSSSVNVSLLPSTSRLKKKDFY